MNLYTLSFSVTTAIILFFEQQCVEHLDMKKTCPSRSLKSIFLDQFHINMMHFKAFKKLTKTINNSIHKQY